MMSIILFIVCVGILLYAADTKETENYAKTVDMARTFLQNANPGELQRADDAWGHRWIMSNSTNDVVLFMSHGADIADASDNIYVRYNVLTHSFDIEFEYKDRMYRYGFSE